MVGFGNLFVVWNLLFAERPSKHFDTTQDVVTDGRHLTVCAECVPRELIVAPGVGIDLTSTYGYASHHSANTSSDSCYTERLRLDIAIILLLTLAK